MMVLKLSYAQISYGVKGGFNYSNIYSTSLKTDFKQGFHAGVYGNVSIIVASIQPEILFSKRGYTETNVKDVDLYYIDVPIMFKLKVLPFVSIDAGPQFSYLLDESLDGVGNSLTVMPNFNKSEVSGAFGASVKVWRIGASARYIVGFSELEKAITSKNQLFQLSLQLKL